MHASAFAMGPGHRDFRHSEAVLSRHVEQLCIESPAFDLLQGKDRDGRALGEGLESALRVFEIQAKEHTQEKIEAATTEPAVQRLFTDLQVSVDPAGAD